MNYFNVISQNFHAVVTSGHASFAYDDAISIGCGYNNNAQCLGTNIKTIVVCAVTPVRPVSTPLYATGIDCFQNYQCTKPGYNTCDPAMGLCSP
uniref:SCP domain-containing protein n=1 Tax=Panagrolaimus davidi TaxID=227884 RepID=A0A914PBF4_9BILA